MDGLMTIVRLLVQNPTSAPRHTEFVLMHLQWKVYQGLKMVVLQMYWIGDIKDNQIINRHHILIRYRCGFQFTFEIDRIILQGLSYSCDFRG